MSRRRLVFRLMLLPAPQNDEYGKDRGSKCKASKHTSQDCAEVAGTLLYWRRCRAVVDGFDAEQLNPIKPDAAPVRDVLRLVDVAARIGGVPVAICDRVRRLWIEVASHPYQ